MESNYCGSTEPTDCSSADDTCKALISSDCVDNVTVDLPFSNIVKGQTLSEVLLQLDTYIESLLELGGNSSVVLENIGGGVKSYKGISTTGSKQLRTLVEGGLIKLTEEEDTITIAVNESALADLIADNLPAGATANGSETKITQGTNVTISGVGTIASPYTINSSIKLNSGSNISITGAGTIGSPYVINSTGVRTNWDSISGDSQLLNKPTFKTINGTSIIGTGDITVIGSDIQLSEGNNITITGDGTLASPYTISSDYVTPNIQEVLTSGNTTNQRLDFINGVGLNPFTTSIYPGTVETSGELNWLGTPQLSSTILGASTIHVNRGDFANMFSLYPQSDVSNTFLAPNKSGGEYTLATTADFKTINGQTIVGEGDISIEAFAPDGSETKVTQGANITVSGAGTTISPYVINGALADGSETKLNPGANVTVTGIGTTVSPYIVNSLYPPFQKIDQGTGSGYIIRDRNETFFGNIGQGAIDFSLSTIVSATYGATGKTAFAIGEANIASGESSFVSGGNNIAAGSYGFVIGNQNKENGYSNFVGGTWNEITNGAYATLIGQFGNIITNNIGNVNAGTNTMFAVGNGRATTTGLLESRSTAFQIYQSGVVLANSLSNALITADVTGKILITKDYLSTVTNGSQTKLTQGTNVTITGVGTVANPYIINSVGGTGGSTTFGTTAGTSAEGNDIRILNGQIAFGWGNHSGLYSLLGHTHNYENPLTFTTTGSATVNRVGNTITIGATAGAGADGNNLLTAVTGSGNGVMTFFRDGTSNLTFDATHTHNYENPLTFATTGSATVSRTGNAITIGATNTDTNTWIPLTGTVSGYVTAQGSSDTTKFLNGNGLWTTPVDTNTTYSAFAGSTTVLGLVPLRSGATTTKFLREDGTWVIPTDTNTDTNTTYTSSLGILLTGTNFTPVYGTTPNTITQGDDIRVTNGQTAFGWGNHSGLYSLLGHTHNYESPLTFTATGSATVSRTGNTITIGATAGAGADGNTYPTAFAWTNGTTAGPTGSLTGTSPGISFASIPAATASISGIVTTAAQTFAGDKTFSGAINGVASNFSSSVKGSAFWNIDDSIPSGMGWELSGTILNVGINDVLGSRFGSNAETSYQGGFMRFDTRTGEPLVSFYTRPANASVVTSVIQFTNTGNASFNGTVTALKFYQSSLRSLKENIISYESDALSLIDNLKIVSFDYKNGEGNNIGVIADDTSLEFLSNENDSVNLYNTIFIQAKAIQELKLKLEAQEERLTRLENLIK